MDFTTTGLNGWDVYGSGTFGNGVAAILGEARSRAHVDIVGAAAEVEIGEIAAVRTAFLLRFDATRFFGLIVNGGQISVIEPNASHTAIPYDPELDRIWRISEAGGTLTFETSSDRTTWRTIGTTTTPSYASALRVVLIGDGGPSGSAARFVGVNREVGPAPWCGVSTLVDSFDQVAPAPFGLRWNNSGAIGACTQRMQNGTAQTTHPSAGNGECTFGSSFAFDVRGGAVSTLITAITNFEPGYTVYLALRDDAGAFAQIAFDNDDMCVTATGANKSCIPYNTSLEYWRLRDTSGTLHFEVSADNVDFTEVTALVPMVDLARAYVHVGTSAITNLGKSISDVNPP
jgi:hypothetical protein